MERFSNTAPNSKSSSFQFEFVGLNLGEIKNVMMNQQVVGE